MYLYLNTIATLPDRDVGGRSSHTAEHGGEAWCGTSAQQAMTLSTFQVIIARDAEGGGDMSFMKAHKPLF
jgi:hypothetical protein